MKRASHNYATYKCGIHMLVGNPFHKTGLGDTFSKVRFEYMCWYILTWFNMHPYIIFIFYYKMNLINNINKEKNKFGSRTCDARAIVTKQNTNTL